ncbi:MAG: two-component sensor histidine kinase, partial [Bacteroidaceae bacterium]|nr:two-component sensor histidine kinase [Bacteroidaceae bacterium]
NAIAYATGASLLKIVCSETEKDGRHFYEFLVSDNGTGVEPQHLEHLFDRFYRVDKGRSRKLGGTGLGLAIVKNAVAAHGGTTTALSTPGGGLTIKFTLARF